MTCSLNTFGKILDLEKIIQFLNNNKEEKPKNDWTSDWDWKEQTSSSTIETNTRALENWFDKFHVSFSPCGNLAVFASDKNMTICMGKWDMNNQLKFSISSKINLSHLEDEYITSILTLPIASQRISGEGLLDWTCILVGFNSGNIRMFTENGTLLITQMFHDTKVSKLKCRTYECSKYIGWISQPEEIEILYENNILVCIDGSNLYHYLRAARKYAATLPGDHNDIMESISSMSLDYKKWKFDSQDSLTDFVSAGLTSENRFDQLFAASMIGGPDEKFESIPPMSNRYIACGNSPYVSIYYAFEGLSQPVLTEVKAVAGKITSSLMSAAKGWMGFGKSSTPLAKPKLKIEPPTNLAQRIGLQDYRRNGESVIISPANNLAATTDSFARVILIDVLKGIAIRIFKGYRDAQIGWICVDDESDDKSNKRYALYLIIYAPRRGLVEIWGCQQGIRVAAFNVGKNCRLIYPGYFMLSLNGSLYNNEYKLSQHIQCLLVNSEGLIKTLNIPFHLILSDKNNQRVRDTILLKKLKSILRENKQESDSLWHSIKIILSEFKTPSIKQQALEKLLNTSYLSTRTIYEIFLNEAQEIRKIGENQSPETHKFGHFCESYSALIKSYVVLNELYSMENLESKESNEENLSELLQIDEGDIKEYFELRKTINLKDSSCKKVKFNDIEKKILDLPKYLSCFDSTPIGNLSNEEDSRLIFDLGKNISISEKERLGVYLFSILLEKDKFLDTQKIVEFLTNIPVHKIKLLDLLIHAWISDQYTNIYNLVKISFILSGFSNLGSKDDDNEIKNYSDPIDHDFEGIFINGYLPKFKNTIESSKSLMQAIIAVWTIRSIVLKSQSDSSQLEMLQLLSDRLYCMIKLSMLFTIGKKSVLNQIDFDYNIKNILTKGKGVLSELASKHVVINDFPPKLLNFIDDEIEDITGEDTKEDLDEGRNLLNDVNYKEFYDTLQETRKFLPKSLESDTLLVNCAWESILFYNRDSEKSVDYLNSSLRFCSEIGNAILKQGILSIIWHSNLNKKVAFLSDLIDKIGRFPNDKSVRKEVGINEEKTVIFLECIMNLLDLIMDANCNINEVPIFNYDKFWKDLTDYNELGLISTNMILNLANSSNSATDISGKLKNTKTSSKQLVELAAEQKPVNYHLCLFQYQLIRILFLIVKYNMKSVRPYSFFDTKGKQALFSELHTHPLISNDVDIKIINSRKLFFTKALNAIMQEVKEPISIKAKLPEDVNESLNTVFNLSKDMDVDAEYIKRYYCCLLYALDYHSEAEKVFHSIKELELLASQLLVVVGHKVNEILEKNFDANLMAILSTNLNSWLKSLGTSDYRIHTISSKQALLELIGIVLNRLPDSFSEYKIAVELFDFLENPLFKL